MTVVSSTAFALGQGELNEVIRRALEDKDAPNIDYQHAIDVRSIKKDWKKTLHVHKSSTAKFMFTLET